MASVKHSDIEKEIKILADRLGWYMEKRDESFSLSQKVLKCEHRGKTGCCEKYHTGCELIQAGDNAHWNAANEAGHIADDLLRSLPMFLKTMGVQAGCVQDFLRKRIEYYEQGGYGLPPVLKEYKEELKHLKLK